MVFFQIPPLRASEAFNAKQQTLPFTYHPVGCTRTKVCPNGFDADYLSVQIGIGGQPTFEKAKQAIKSWRMFPNGWTEIVPHVPIAIGQQVSMYARFGGFWWRNACKIVYVVDEPDKYGFAYGTTPGHMECGEELFLIECLPDGTIWYTIRAYSKPRHIFAKIGYPLMRLLQARFRKDSGIAMQLKQEQ
jgi:uncharacterized protein (UPF0548 family)